MQIAQFLDVQKHVGLLSDRVDKLVKISTEHGSLLREIFEILASTATKGELMALSLTNQGHHLVGDRYSSQDNGKKNYVEERLNLRDEERLARDEDRLKKLERDVLSVKQENAHMKTMFQEVEAHYALKLSLTGEFSPNNPQQTSTSAYFQATTPSRKINSMTEVFMKLHAASNPSSSKPSTPKLTRRDFKEEPVKSNNASISMPSIAMNHANLDTSLECSEITTRNTFEHSDSDSEARLTSNEADYVTRINNCRSNEHITNTDKDADRDRYGVIKRESFEMSLDSIKTERDPVAPPSANQLQTLQVQGYGDLLQSESESAVSDTQCDTNMSKLSSSGGEDCSGSGRGNELINSETQSYVSAAHGSGFVDADVYSGSGGGAAIATTTTTITTTTAAAAATAATTATTATAATVNANANDPTEAVKLQIPMSDSIVGFLEDEDKIDGIAVNTSVRTAIQTFSTTNEQSYDQTFNVDSDSSRNACISHTGSHTLIVSALDAVSHTLSVSALAGEGAKESAGRLFIEVSNNTSGLAPELTSLKKASQDQDTNPVDVADPIVIIHESVPLGHNSSLRHSDENFALESNIEIETEAEAGIDARSDAHTDIPGVHSEADVGVESDAIAGNCGDETLGKPHDRTEVAEELSRGLLMLSMAVDRKVCLFCIWFTLNILLLF